ncbi:MAG: hypothetical protein NDJ89_16210 [Oligoflexia bacterium]|nr:hypothetical protein [Oligoflexia bacterium]
MRARALLVFGLLAAVVFGPVSARAKALELTTAFELSQEPLSTEKIWNLDPEERNPHRQRWVLHRQVRLKGLEARALSAGSFGVRAGLLESLARGYLRPEGPWYRPWTEFPCTAEPQEWFAQQDGTRTAIEEGGKAWSKLLRKQLLALELKLERVRESSDSAAIRRALMIYEEWLKALEAEWREISRGELRRAEWRAYQEAAVRSGLCRQGGVGRLTAAGAVRPPRWEALMESPGAGRPAASPTPPPWKPLVRAPARRWDGVFSVRLTVVIGAKSLTGQFLLDSAAPKSILSPAWLSSQGMLPALVEVPGAPLEKARLTGLSGLGPRGWVDHARLSGHELELTEFVIYDVDLFGPPKHLSSCCDGILGQDFLQKFVVELRPGPPAEVLLWPREGFRSPREGDIWAEASLGNEVPESRCEVRSEADPFGSAGSRRFERVGWGTGVTEPLLAGAGAARVLEGRKAVAGWSVECGSRIIARQVALHAGLRAGPTARRRELTGVDLVAGIPFLARGPVVFDLPHGRIWFSQEAISSPVLDNRSGLETVFELRRGERRLIVRAIRPNSRAETLRKAGLRPGMLIEQLDSRLVEEMDQWEVDQRMAGAYGDEVTLQWSERKRAKIVPFKVRDRE